MNNQSEDRVLGYVGTYPVGDYSEQTEYEYLNVVTHKGSSYVCIKEEGCIAVEPPNEEYWQLFAGKGDTGGKGEKGDIGPIGPKPVNGVDYNTEAEQKEFKDKVVADSKADLEKYITEKETQLDNYTKDKETKLDTYVTDTVKPTIDTYVTDTTKKDIDKYEKEKEKVLDTYTDTKKTEIDNYITNTSKPALDQYEKDKEAELETAKNTAIVEYDAHAESVLTETNDLFNALDTEKASGTELYIEDAKPCRIMNTEIGGMYKQETTTGANLLDTSDMLFNNGTLEQNGLTAKINTDGSIVINGTATANTYFKKSIKNILEDGNYYFYNFNNVTQSNSTYYMLIQGNKSTGYGSTDYYNARGYQTDNFIKDIITYDRTFDCTFVFINGFVANNLILYPEISKTKQTVFESYTGGNPSPNPDYPQKIEQVESVKLNINNKNLLNPIFTVGSNCTIENQTITSTVLLAQTLQFIRFGFPKIKLKKGIKYYISFRAKKINTNYAGGFNQIQLFTADNKKFITFSAIANPNLNANYQIYNFVSANITEEQALLDYVKILIQRKNIAEDLVFAITDVMVTKENTEYTAYQNQAINIDLKGNKLCAISSTIKGKLLIDRSGNVVLQKNVNKYIFTGDENFIINSTTDSYNEFTCVIPNLYSKKYFETKSNKFLYNLDNRISISDTGAFYIRTPIKLQIDTIDKFRAIIKDTEVYYVLATPEIIDLGQLPELLKTFEGINNIWAETNLGNTKIEIEYVQDVKKLLEKQAEQQNARLDNIEALLSTTETSALLLDNMQTDLEKEVE